MLFSLLCLLMGFPELALVFGDVVAETDTEVI